MRARFRSVSALVVLELGLSACDAILGLEDFRVAETRDAGRIGSGAGAAGSSGSDSLGTGGLAGNSGSGGSPVPVGPPTGGSGGNNGEGRAGSASAGAGGADGEENPTPDAGEPPPASGGSGNVTLCDNSDCESNGGVCVGDTCVFECDEDVVACNASEVECPDDVDCRVRCVDDDTCSQMIICGRNATCTVDCADSRTCTAVVDCADSEACNINCIGDDTCTAVVDCADSGACNINCIGDNSCGVAFTVDNADGDVRVACEGAFSCNSDVICGGGPDACDVSCDGINSCASLLEPG